MKNLNVALVLALLLPAGCVTKKQIAGRPSDAGIKVVYPQDFAKVKRAALDALGELAFEVKEDKWADEYRYQIIASQGLTTGTPGRLVRILIEKGEKERTTYILVESRAGSQDSATIDDAIARDLHRKMDVRLVK